MSMSPYENTKLVSIGLDSNGKLYFLKSLSVNDFKTLWQRAYAEETRLLDENLVEAGLGVTSLSGEETRSYQKQKRRESQETSEQMDGISDHSPNEKRQRVVWTDWMHHKFMEAVNHLGPERAFPKKILELMNVPGLTRESVASHLQKYRQGIRRAEGVIHPTSCIFLPNLTTTHLKQNCFSSSHSALNFNSSQGNPLHLDKQPDLMSYQPGSNYSLSFHPEASTSTSNLGHEQLLAGSYPYGHSVSLSGTTQPNFNVVSSYVGYRLSSNGKSVELGRIGVPNDDENRADNGSLSAGGSGNESLVQTPSVFPGDYIPQQQPPSQPPAHSVAAHDSDNLGLECDVDRLLDATTGSTSPEFFWGDFDHALFDNTE